MTKRHQEHDDSSRLQQCPLIVSPTAAGMHDADAILKGLFTAGMRPSMRPVESTGKSPKISGVRGRGFETFAETGFETRDKMVRDASLQQYLHTRGIPKIPLASYIHCTYVCTCMYGHGFVPGYEHDTSTRVPGRTPAPV